MSSVMSLMHYIAKRTTLIPRSKPNSACLKRLFKKDWLTYQHGDFYNPLNVASELKALPPYSNIVLLEQLLPNAALSVHAGSQ
jgi:hypothetical protein